MYVYKSFLKRLAIKLFDTVGTVLIKAGRHPSRTLPDNAAVKRVLIIRLDHLGDLIMTLPAIRAIRHQYPNAEIDILTDAAYQEILTLESSIDSIIAIRNHWFSRPPAGFFRQFVTWQALIKSFKKRSYDIGIDFRGDVRHLLLFYLSKIPGRLGYGITGGRFLTTHSKEYSMTRHQTELNQNLLETLGIPIQKSFEGPVRDTVSPKKNTSRVYQQALNAERPRIFLHQGAGYPSKRWPANHFKLLVDHLLRHTTGTIILIGNRQEKIEQPSLAAESIQMLDLRGETSLKDLPSLLSAGDLFIGQDSGPSHLAAMQNIPCLILFSGANDKRRWAPKGSKVFILSHDIACSPCESKECPLGHHDCMNEISVASVITEAMQILDRSNAENG